MCLSTVYMVENGVRRKLAEQVSGVAVSGAKVTLTDLMGEETSLRGVVTSVDLQANEIFIAPAAADSV